MQGPLHLLAQAQNNCLEWFSPWQSSHKKSKKINKLDISCEAFAGYSVSKILSLHQDLPAMVDAVQEQEAPWSSIGPTLDHFNLISQEKVDRILIKVSPTTCPLIFYRG